MENKAKIGPVDYVQLHKLYVKTLLKIITNNHWAITVFEPDVIMPLSYICCEINGYAEYKGMLFEAQAKITWSGTDLEYVKTHVMQKLIDNIVEFERAQP